MYICAIFRHYVLDIMYFQRIIIPLVIKHPVSGIRPYFRSRIWHGVDV